MPIATAGTDVYLDTAIVVKLVAPEPDSAYYARVVDRQIAWSSEVVVTEAFSALLRKQREGSLSAPQRRAAWRQIEDDVDRGRIALVGIDRHLLERANQILDRVHPTVALRSLDAIHLASAEQCRSWPLCSNDGRIRDAATLLAMPLTPLPHKP